MWLFNRNKDQQPAVPKEIKKYYQAEKRERAGIAWLLGIATLLVTIALAILIFFGGRWAYRTIFDNNDTQGTETTQTENENTEPESQQQPEPAPEVVPEQTPVPEVTPTPQPTPQPAPTPAPVTGDDLPNTGPADTLAIFAAVVVLATIGHAALTRKATNK